jgi:hypothetical protein
MSLALTHARADITPTGGYTLMGGYGQTAPAAARRATGTYAPLWARAAVLWDNGFPNVIVAVDTLCISPSANSAVRAAVPQVPRTDLVILGSHTHTGPAAPQAPDVYNTYGVTDQTQVEAYGQQMVAGIIQAIQDALDADPFPVTLDYITTTQSWARQRAGNIETETVVPVLTARRADGRPAMVLYSYGCHPVTAGVQTRWDGDYPAAASAAIEAIVPGSIALYMPGPSGDQDPAGIRGWALRNQRGAELAAAVFAAPAARQVAGPILSVYGEVALPLEITNTAAGRAALRAGYQARATAGTDFGWNLRHAAKQVERIDAGQIQTTVTVPVQRWRLSGVGGTPRLQLSWVGGEIMAGYGNYLRSLYGGPGQLMIGGYANWCNCYIPSNAMLPPRRISTGYEAGFEASAPSLGWGGPAVYGAMGRFRADTNGVGGAESALLAAIRAQLD